MTEEGFEPKKEWPDGQERVCSGSKVVFGGGHRDILSVTETPSEVEAIRKLANITEPLLELHHHADPTVRVYVDKFHIRAIDAIWDKIEE